MINMMSTNAVTADKPTGGSNSSQASNKSKRADTRNGNGFHTILSRTARGKMPRGERSDGERNTPSTASREQSDASEVSGAAAVMALPNEVSEVVSENTEGSRSVGIQPDGHAEGFAGSIVTESQLFLNDVGEVTTDEQVVGLASQDVPTSGFSSDGMGRPVGLPTPAGETTMSTPQGGIPSIGEIETLLWGGVPEAGDKALGMQAALQGARDYGLTDMILGTESQATLGTTAAIDLQSPIQAEAPLMERIDVGALPTLTDDADNLITTHELQMTVIETDPRVGANLNANHHVAALMIDAAEEQDNPSGLESLDTGPAKEETSPLEGYNIKFSLQHDDVHGSGSHAVDVDPDLDVLDQHAQSGRQVSQNAKPSAAKQSQSVETAVQPGASDQDTVVEPNVAHENVDAAVFEPTARAETASQARGTLTVREGVPAEPQALGEIIRSVVLDSVNEVQTVRVELHPRHLGRLELRVAMENGALTAQIVAESEATRQTIETALPHLRQHLVAQGMAVESISVSIGGEGGQFQPHDSPGDGRRSGSSSRQASSEPAARRYHTEAVSGAQLASDTAIDILA